jgi:hypothetical protein
MPKAAIIMLWIPERKRAANRPQTNILSKEFPRRGASFCSIK